MPSLPFLLSASAVCAVASLCLCAHRAHLATTERTHRRYVAFGCLPAVCVLLVVLTAGLICL